MRTVTKTTSVYSFNELNEEARQNAIDNLWDINEYSNWLENVYEDAKEIGLKISSFDIGRGRCAEGELIGDMNNSINSILSNHGENTDTHKLALSYQIQWFELVCKYSDGVNTDIVSEGNEFEFDQEADVLEIEFSKDLLEEYLIMLEKEYEYQTSEEAIIETIKANEYEFDEEGNLF